ncbi:MAG: hypothetical protein ACI9JN_000738 [Bacteroidia bacterium]|jgi:hypothetical protein
MKKAILISALPLILLTLLYSCKKVHPTGMLVASINNGAINLELSQDKIEKDINLYLSAAEIALEIKSINFLEKEGRNFLKVSGSSNETCMVALIERDSKLYELNDDKTGFVICYGCIDGCDPEYKSPNWSCSTGCSDCTKSVTVSDDYIFK